MTRIIKVNGLRDKESFQNLYKRAQILFLKNLVLEYVYSVLIINTESSIPRPIVNFAALGMPLHQCHFSCCNEEYFIEAKKELNKQGFLITETNKGGTIVSEKEYLIWIITEKKKITKKSRINS